MATGYVVASYHRLGITIAIYLLWLIPAVCIAIVDCIKSSYELSTGCTMGFVDILN